MLCLVANNVTLGRLSNLLSADHEDVSVPVRQVSHKKVKVVVYWAEQSGLKLCLEIIKLTAGFLYTHYTLFIVKHVLLTSAHSCRYPVLWQLHKMSSFWNKAHKHWEDTVTLLCSNVTQSLELFTFICRTAVIGWLKDCMREQVLMSGRWEEMTCRWNTH